MSTVFISYSHVDTSTADELESLLADLDIDYFRDLKDINWGNSITSKVRDGLDACVAILVIVSPASLKSHWVPYEIGHAAALRKIILPFLTHPSLDVPHYIRDLNCATTVEQVKDYFTNTFDQEAKDIFQPTEQITPSQRQFTLDDMQRGYLLEISKPRNEGSVYGGIDERTGRDVAPYQEAVELFQGYGLMQYSGGGYKLTSKGWKLADQLWALKVLDALDFNQFTDHKDLAEAVGLTDGQVEMDELKRHVDALEEHGWVKVNSNMRDWSVRIVEEGVAQRKHRTIEL